MVVHSSLVIVPDFHETSAEFGTVRIMVEIFNRSLAEDSEESATRAIAERMDRFFIFAERYRAPDRR